MIADGYRSAVLAGLLVFTISLAAHADQSGAETPGLDPVVAQVVEMLDAGVDEEIIDQWLATTDRRPADIGAQGLITLTQAGASKDLIGHMLELVAETTSVPEPHIPVQMPPAGAEQESAPQLLDPDGDEAHRAADVDTPADVLFLLSYKRIITQEPEPDSPQPEPWTVFAYLDGELVAWVTDSMAAEPVRANRQLAPGRHLVRVTRERHIQRGRRWVHETQVAPTSIAFDVVPGQGMEVDIRFHGHWMDRQTRGPLSYAVRQGNQTLAEEGPTGGNPSEWQLVCEDVEANFPDAEKVPRLYRRDMARCTSWTNLWNGAGEQTSRTELLASMSESDFRPSFR